MKTVLFLGGESNSYLAKNYLIQRGFDVLTEDSYSGQSVDLIISYLHRKKIPGYILFSAKVAINFHPAPLPEGRISRTYPFAILEERDYYTVTCHHLSKEFDAGDIIDSLSFPIDSKTETCQSLKKKAHDYLLKLFKYLIDFYILADCFPEGSKQDETKAQSCTMRELEEMKALNLQITSAKEISKNIRAFWNPPYHTVKILLDGKWFSLVSEEILDQLVPEKEKEKTVYPYQIVECGIIVNPTKGEMKENVTF